MVEEHFTTDVSFDIVMDPQSLILTHSVYSKGNLCNITKTMPVDISMKLGVFENIHIGQNYSSFEVQSYTALFK